MANLPTTQLRFTANEVGSRYEVGELLASGGMASVYRAFDRLAQRPVAYKRLKIVNESDRSRFAALFRREYDTLAHLAHPNIVEAYEFGFDACGPYYAMELLSGADLAQLAPLPVYDACRVLRDLASALALLHARRLVHRDISASNVRLTRDGSAKLIDFGGLTPFGTPSEIVGTTAFIAPECLSGAPLDARTDLYALGVLAYWTLTRRMCVNASTIEGLVEAWKKPIVPPSRYVPEVSPALDELLLALLQRDPVARPTSAADVIARLTSIANLPPEQDERRVAYSYLQHAPLRGREQVVADLRQALHDAVAGNGQIVLLAAEQGLGRSALLRQLAVDAQLAGATVLSANGGLHSGPFSAARHVTQTGLGTFPELAQSLDERGSLERPDVVGNGEKIGVRSTRSARSTIDASERQAQTASLLQEALLELSLRNPLVLLVDDAHAIDAESLSLFASMVDVVHSHPLLLALSTRAGDTTQHPQALSKLEANAKRCKLSALGGQHIAELVSTMFGAVRNSHHLTAWLYDQTGGNPAHCMDLARVLLAQGAIRYTVGTFTLPYEFDRATAGDGHAEAPLASVAGLTAHAGQVAHLVGLHSGPVTTAELAHASGLDEREVLLALEELVQRGVVVSSGERYSCASEALRAALSGWRSPAETRAAHLALARAFARHDQAVLEHRLATARHLLKAGGDDAFEGACLLARTADEHKFAMAMSRSTLALLEQAIEVLAARGVADRECLGLLVPLSLAGFYGELESQRRYLDRTLRTLSSLCGITLARRFRPWLGPRLSLVFGIIVGLVAFSVRPRSLNRRGFVQLFEAYGSLPGAAAAAAACVWDVAECYRLAAWLDPFEYASKRGALYLMREFCLATGELVAVKLSSSIERYSRLLSSFERRVFGLNSQHVEQFRCGCLYGKAQALVTHVSPLAIEVADELARRSTFFAPHAEGVRMTYYALRGEAQRAAVHRERAEALAFRGGTSWSATSVLTIRSVQACMMTGDAVGMVHVVAALERLSKLSASMGAIYELAQGHLEQLRGRPARALPIYERVFAGSIARSLPTYAAERALHAQALSAVGDCAAAKAISLALVEEFTRDRDCIDNIFLITHQQLALAEAGLGQVARAVELLESCFERAGRYDNPLSLGTVHRDRAYVAALARDVEGFDHHFAAMTALFRATENPWLIQQCDGLRAQAVRLGIASAVPSDAHLAPDLDAQTAIATRGGRALEDVS